MERKHLQTLDYARGIAIIAVLLCHSLSCVYGYDFIRWDGWTRDFIDAPLSDLTLFPLSFGQGGVALFFVISGFCIHLSFQQQPKSWANFFIRRAFRIYPAYMAAVALFVGLNLAMSQKLGLSELDFKHIGMHLLLVHNFSTDTFKSINGSFWSLAVEAQLYALYPVLLLLVRNLGWRTTLIALATVELSSAEIGGFAYMLPTAYWFSWSLGARIAESFLRGDRLPFLNISPLWPATVAVAAYFFKPLNPFWFTAWAATSAVALSGALSSPDKSRTPQPVLAALKNIGIWSYSLYLLHQPLEFVYYYALDWLTPFSNDSDPFALLLAMLTWLAIIPLSILWYNCFEISGIKLGKRLTHATQEPLRFHTKNFAAAAAVCALLLVTFEAKIKYSPQRPDTENNAAWNLATNADPSKRNGRLAVKHAERACQQTEYANPVMVGTLAAAYAEAGRFDDAIATAKRAENLALASNLILVFQRNEQFCELYRNHQAYHAPPQGRQ